MNSLDLKIPKSGQSTTLCWEPEVSDWPYYENGTLQNAVKAIVGALEDVRKSGKQPKADIMVPLVSDVKELNLVRSWIEQEVSSLEPELRPSIGTMIETPRSAITAEEIAGGADFFSFGTNDLTQLVLDLVVMTLRKPRL